MTTVSVRMDDALKKELETVCDEMGMSMATCFMIYAKRVARDRRIPFDVSAPTDPLYSASNMKALRESMQQAREGKTVRVSMEELEAIANA